MRSFVFFLISKKFRCQLSKSKSPNSASTFFSISPDPPLLNSFVLTFFSFYPFNLDLFGLFKRRVSRKIKSKKRTDSLHWCSETVCIFFLLFSKLKSTIAATLTKPRDLIRVLINNKSSSQEFHLKKLWIYPSWIILCYIFLFPCILNIALQSFRT